MPYLLFVAGILIGFYAFLKFFLKSTPNQIRKFFLTIFLALYGLVLIEFALTGRLAIAIILLLALIPFIIAHYRRKAKARKALPPPKSEKND